MNLKIITQERIVFEGEVDEVYARGIDGEFGILRGHIPVMVALDIGVTRAKLKTETKSFAVMGGILQYKDDECLILTTLAEAGDEIDEIRAKESLERAHRRLNDAKAKIDSKRVEASIARAKARLKAKLNSRA